MPCTKSIRELESWKFDAANGRAKQREELVHLCSINKPRCLIRN